MKVLVVNGPNLNLLGEREPDKYGTKTLAMINEELESFAKQNGDEIEFFQSNIEGEIVDAIQNARGNFDGIILNPAAYTHTSVAIRDALLATRVPTVEVHLSNIASREDFRKNSFIAPNCIGQITGFKKEGYKLALIGLYNHLK